jgi:lipid-A-disaccharide synthase-like uncharacterized protein
VNNELLTVDMFHRVWVITPWKLIGYFGALTFAGRWVVQVIASHRAGHSHLPRVFWYMSLVGSLCLLSYFCFSNKNDSVGILSNLFPTGVALYNLYLLEAGRPVRVSPPAPDPTPQ